VWVIADNCSDATADRARAAGAHVLVRDDRERRGKGYALEHAFACLLEDGFAEAMVVVDADTVVSRNLLAAFSARLEAGAAAIQADYRVRNPDASWRTRLMAVALALMNTLRCLGRDRLGCSVGLRGNGMCFSARLLREVPHRAFSIVEDLEYGIRLGLAGHRVCFASEALVLGEMVSGATASRSQRRRWERGRREMARRHGVSLLLRGLAHGDRVLVDLGLDLLVPPLAFLGVTAVAGTAASLVSAELSGSQALAWSWGACLAALCAYALRGWWLSGTGLRGLSGLLFAPAFLVWKVGLALTRPETPLGAWVRTERERRS
jgi:cellulose synthase/poly-beta-1,6-N-acetylglucosamine synthase-like glycosyltransferase